MRPSSSQRAHTIGQKLSVNFGVSSRFVGKNMKQVLPHIQIGLHNDEHVIVVVGDYELADFIEDYLGDDCDLPYDYRTTTQRSSGETITLHFPESALFQEIEGSLSKLSSDEIEGIYRLNN
ncbi:hypothetical protein LP419_31340 [Massilia sp. H-1]|nr:hypothetical protein LP419_31340 [Massilia sp. H-1]